MIRYKNKRLKKKAQTVLEYTFLLGVIFAIGVVMSTMVKRTAQAMVKMMSDQVGVQEDAEQIGGKRGIMINSTMQTQLSASKTKEEDMGEITYSIMRGQVARSETYGNLGFSEK